MLALCPGSPSQIRRSFFFCIILLMSFRYSTKCSFFMTPAWRRNITRGFPPWGVKRRRAAMVRFFHEPEEVIIGVLPLSDHVRRTTGRSEIPLSSSNPMQNPCARAHFFYARQSPSFPVRNVCFIPLLYLEMWFLRREAKTTDNLPCSDGSKFYPCCSFQDLREARECPEIRIIAACKWSLQYRSFEYPALLVGKGGGKARRTFGLQATYSLLAPRRIPLAGGGWTYS